MDNIIIYSKGLNGSKTYSIFSADSGKPIITNKKKEELSENFVRMYRGAAEKINEHLQNFSGLPSEVNLNHLDGGDSYELIELISLEFLKKLKK